MESSTEHAVVIAGGGPTGMMLAAELALAHVDVVIVERRPNQELAGSRAGGLHSRTIEVFDQRGIADRFLAEGKKAQVAALSFIPLDISDFPTRHNYDGGRSLIRKAAGIEFPGWEATTSNLIAEVEVVECWDCCPCETLLLESERQTTGQTKLLPVLETLSRRSMTQRRCDR